MAATTEPEKTTKSNDEESQKSASSSESDQVESSSADTNVNESSNAGSDSATENSAASIFSNSSAASNDVSQGSTKSPGVSPSKNTAVVSNASESAISSTLSHPHVEQKLAEMMEIDTSDIGDKDADSNKDAELQSTASNASIGDLNDLNDEPDEMDVSDVSSSIAENENDSKTPSPRLKKPRKRQPPIMIGYKKRRKAHVKKVEDDVKIESEVDSPINESIDEKSIDESKKLDLSSASSDDNASETSSTRSTSRSVAMVDKYCWICHKEAPNSYKCIACPRVYHPRCLVQNVEDPDNFHCPECSAILKADNVNTRSPVMQAVNLDQLCTLLTHVINVVKSQKDAHHFFGPVDTREFPHYREYVVYPMDILSLEKNVKNKVYGCTEAFLADMKWIVHNSIVFNTKTAKITNVAKNLLKTCKREVSEIETCAECYYNLLVCKDNWFIEACKRPHLLIWARLKGYPPWPAKAIRCKDELVDCRFFGAHDKAWVPLKDVYLYSKVSPQIVKVKPGSNLDEGIQEIEKHIKKLKEKFGSFVYAEYKEPYNPSAELEQLKSMLPKYNPDLPPSTTKTPTPFKSTLKSKISRNEPVSSPTSATGSKSPVCDRTPVSAKTEPSIEDPARNEKKNSTETVESNSDAAKLVCDESSFSASADSRVSVSEGSKNTTVDDPSGATAESNQTEVKTSTVSSAGSDKARDSTDTEAEESDSSRSTTKSTSASETSQKQDSIEKKLVSVKKIESINATVTPERTITRPVPIAPKPVPGLVATNPIASLANIVNSTVASGNSPVIRKVADTKIEMIRSVRTLDDKPKSKITVKHFASFEKCDTTNGKSSPSTQAPPLAPIASRKEPVKSVNVTDQDFNLDKVKDEPIEVDTSSQNEDPIFVKEIPPPPQPPIRATLNKPIISKTTPDLAHRKRSMVEDTDSNSTDSGKKSKTDSSCRTVNITENVTLSLINNQLTNTVENVPAALPAKIQTVLKPKPPAKAYVVAASNVSSPDTPTLTTTHTHNNPITKPVRIAPAPGPTPIRMYTTAQQQRIVNGNAALNGTPMQPRSNILVVQSPKQPVKNPTFGQNTFAQNGSGDIIVQFMSELLNSNRKAMEETLDKIAGKGDLRAKVILLQKEIENMKKNHEMTVDEIKRDYEVQIAELRAASLAQKKYDLAHERLKFEKEKEQAVKEAKSKQWCSNCQKSANYYCCWNTAYCDFECQKEHWNQHMHVCKNDVKRKTAECSENEPPRIMMQNDVLSDYKSMMNGYDKMSPTTHTYQNSNNVSSSSRSNGGAKIQTNNPNSKRYARPLLPRVTATVTCTPSGYSTSTPAVTATLVDNSYNASTTVTPLRSTMIGSVNVHPLIRQVSQQQYHK